MKIPLILGVLCSLNVKVMGLGGKMFSMNLSKYPTKDANVGAEDATSDDKFLGVVEENNDGRRKLVEIYKVDVGNLDAYQYEIEMYVGSLKKKMTFMLDTGNALTWISTATRKKCHNKEAHDCEYFDYRSSRTNRMTST